MADEKLTINVTVGPYPVRLSVPREDEGVYRQAQKAVNQLYDRLVQMYPTKNPNEIWALTAYQSAIAALKSQQRTTGPAVEQIKKVEEELDKILSL